MSAGLLKKSRELAMEATQGVIAKAATTPPVAEAFPPSPAPMRMGGDLLGSLALSAGKKSVPVRDPLSQELKRYQAIPNPSSFEVGEVDDYERIFELSNDVIAPNLSRDNDISESVIAPLIPLREPVTKEAYDGNFNNIRLSPFSEKSILEKAYVESTNARRGASSDILGIPEENMHALGKTNELMLEAQETGSVVGLLRRQNELYNQGRVGGSADGAVPQAGTAEGLEYGLLGDQISQMERASFLGPGGYGPMAPHRSQQATRRLYSGEAYDEAVHARANLATATEAVTEGSTNGNFVPGTLAFNETSSSNALIGAGDASGMAGIGSSMVLGAALGGAANYAMGGEFSEGAIMGGLAGGGINIGARAIRANQSGIEGFLQRSVLKEGAGADRFANANAIQEIANSPESMNQLGFMQRAAANRLMTDPNKSAGLQSRHMVVGGSMLAGVAFTGRRNDKRRGFNAHRGNRI